MGWVVVGGGGGWCGGGAAEGCPSPTVVQDRLRGLRDCDEMNTQKYIYWVILDYSSVTAHCRGRQHLSMNRWTSD